MTFALADCNNFYVSCERVFNPALLGKAVVVLSSNDGCVISRSDEAKALGITMGLPLFKARDLVKAHDVVVLSSNYALYGSMSKRVMDTLATFEVGREIYSIDEAFLELPELAPDELTALGLEMRERVLRWTGIPISVGIGETKTLAKIANRMVKRTEAPGGVVNLMDASDRDAALVSFPVGDVWGVGHGIRKSLELSGIRTAAQLRDVDTFWMKSEHGVKGLALVLELRGQVCHNLNETPANRKEILVTRTFGRRLRGVEQLAPAFAEFARKGAERLASAGMKAKSITAFIAMDRHQPDYQGGSSVELELEIATSDPDSLAYFAHEALRQLVVDSREYKKGGLIFAKLSPATVVQETFFSAMETSKGAANRQKFRLTSEALNQKLDGDGGPAKHGLLPQDGLWKQRREHMSPRYTTQWSELPVVH